MTQTPPSSQVTRPLVGALDIGGTKMLAGLFSLTGELLASRRVETQPARGPEAILAHGVTLLRDLARSLDASLNALLALGCSIPGPLDRKRGVVVFSPNLGWRDFPFSARLGELLAASGVSNLPIALDDDAHCAALGETRWGAARKASSAVYLTISTGIGGGVVIGGELYHGAHDCAGEVGHITLESEGPRCSCGNNGCFEALASGSAIARSAREAVLRGEATLLAQLVADTEQLTAMHVFQAAEQGDLVALGILETTATYLGLGLAAVATSFDPEMIVVGGGVLAGAGGAQLLRQACKVFAVRVIAPLGDCVRIVPAALGAESALYGAAYLALAAGATKSYPS